MWTSLHTLCLTPVHSQCHRLFECSRELMAHDLLVDLTWSGSLLFFCFVVWKGLVISFEVLVCLRNGGSFDIITVAARSAANYFHRS